MYNETTSLGESIEEMRKRHDEMRSAMKLKLGKKNSPSQEEIKDNQKKSPAPQTNEVKFSLGNEITFLADKDKEYAKPIAANNNTPLNKVSINLFQNEGEKSGCASEDSFQDVEDYVVGILNDCEMTKRLSLS